MSGGLRSYGHATDGITPSPLFCSGRGRIEFYACRQAARHRSAAAQLADSPTGKGAGTPLFLRRTRGVELTNAGKLMLEEARLILTEVETAKAGCDAAPEGRADELRSVSAAGHSSPALPAIIREYRTDYPDVILFPAGQRHRILDRAAARRTDRHCVCAAACRRRGRSRDRSRLSKSRPSWRCRPASAWPCRLQLRFGRSRGKASCSIRGPSILAFMIRSSPRSMAQASLRYSVRRRRRSRPLFHWWRPLGRFDRAAG